MLRNSSTSFPLLALDIGGTHVRFGCMLSVEEGLRDIRAYRCAYFTSPVDAASHYLAEVGLSSVARVTVAIAGVVSSGPIKLTNSNWVFESGCFAASVGATSIEMFNDFEAIALVLPYLVPEELNIVGSATINQTWPMAVIGPGTGLGVAGIIPIRSQPGNWQTMCGEGGHTTIPAATRHQHEVIVAARQEIEHLDAEQLVSGIGLPTLYRAVARVDGLIADDIDAAEIGARGSSGSDMLAARTLDTFCGFLGSIAGNLALTMGAKGGVFIAGGIVPQWGSYFTRSSFRAHFENNKRYRDYLAPIATAVITAPYPGLMGLVQHAARTLPAR